MPRVISLALSQIEAQTSVFPRFERLRNAYARFSRVEDAAVVLYSKNEAIRGSSRGWMI
jgi:hypothetical protein